MAYYSGFEKGLSIMAERLVKKNKPGIDLAKLFGVVANNLVENRDSLNEADSYNNDHGDNMVNIFQSIAKSIQGKSNLDQASQLALAGKEIRKNKSGSAQLYADGLDRASKTFKGKSITPDSATALIQELLGGGQTRNETTQNEKTSNDLLGSILGSLSGETSNVKTDQNSSLDVGDLLSAGMAFMDTKQKGGSNVEAIISAVLKSSPMGQTDHRSQSGALVVNTIMQYLGKMKKS
jgi:hypothetical protein